MALQQRIVRVDQGVVTSRDPSMLDNGELQRADDAEYLPGDDRLHKVDSRREFNSSAEGAGIEGGIFAQFEDGLDRFIVATSTTYKQDVADATGAFSNLVTGLTAMTHLDDVQYDNKYHLLDGVNRIRNVGSDLSVSFTGMKANTDKPLIQRSAGAGTGFSLSDGFAIWYWLEERVKDGDTIVRRNAATADETVQLAGDGGTVKPVITSPGTVNSDATHIALFATAATKSLTDNPFPTGAEITEVPISETTIEDPRETADPAIPDGPAYEIVTVSLGGAARSVPKWGPPPDRCDTGDIFEDAMVVNDLDKPRLIRWSFFDNMHAWPSINLARIGDTKFSDNVKLIRRLGNFIVIACQDSVWRMHMLPTAEDSAFQPQRVREMVHDAHGCVGPKGGALFDFGRGPRLAYISRYGLMATDGFQWDDISDDLAWEQTFNISALSDAVLIYNPSKYRLEMYARPTEALNIALGTDFDTATNSVGYFFHVHPSHAKHNARGGVKAKVTGPITVPDVNDAFIATVNNKRRVMLCSDDGKVYFEDDQASDDSGEGINFVAQTAEVYLAGAGNEAIDRRVGFHHSAGAHGQTAAITLIARKAEQEDMPITRIKSIERRELTVTHQQGNAETYSLKVENSDSLGSFSVDFGVMGFEAEGESRT